jgi:hypothetical protein
MIIIEATLIKKLDKATLFDCEGDKIWISNNNYKYNPDSKDLEIPLWLAKEKFPNEF